MARKTIYECDVCGVGSEKPTIRVAIQLYTTDSGYPQYKTEDKWDVCQKCGQEINAFIYELRKQKRGEPADEE